MRRLLPVFFFFLFTLAEAQHAVHYPKGSSLIKVFLRNGEQYTGILINADTAGLTVASLNNMDETSRFAPQAMHRFEIRKVNKVKRNAAIGAGIGFLTGFVIGWEEYDTPGGTDVNQVGRAAGSGFLGAFAGGFIGFITGMTPKTFYVLGNYDQYQKILPELATYKIPVPHEN
ncbi:MAG: hypothetical protein ACK4RF_00260 [Cyclobacteriaceae bacterium]